MGDFFVTLAAVLVLCIPATIIATIIVCVIKKKLCLFAISIPINISAILLCIIIGAFTSDQAEPSQQTNNNVQTEQNNSSNESNKQDEVEEEKEETVSFVYEKIEVTYLGYEKYSDEQIFVYFEMKNNSDEKVTFDFKFDVCAYQGGIELETNYIYDCDEEKNGSLEINSSTNGICLS